MKVLSGGSGHNSQNRTSAHEAYWQTRWIGVVGEGGTTWGTPLVLLLLEQPERLTSEVGWFVGTASGGAGSLILNESLCLLNVLLGGGFVRVDSKRRVVLHMFDTLVRFEWQGGAVEALWWAGITRMLQIDPIRGVLVSWTSVLGDLWTPDSCWGS